MAEHYETVRARRVVQERLDRAWLLGYHSSSDVDGSWLIGSRPNPFSHESKEASKWREGRQQYIDDVNYTWGVEGE